MSKHDKASVTGVEDIQAEESEERTPVENVTNTEANVENVSAKPDQKRVPRLTAKGLQAKIEQLKKARSAKLRKLTSKRNHIESLMLEYDNLELIQQLYKLYNDLINEFAQSQLAAYELLSEENRDLEHSQWYLPKIAHFK